MALSAACPRSKVCPPGTWRPSSAPSGSSSAFTGGLGIPAHRPPHLSKDRGFPSSQGPGKAQFLLTGRNNVTQAGRISIEEDRSSERREGSTGDKWMYLRFGAMIATAMAVMYGVTYLNTFELAHVRWSEHRLFMVLLMGAAMAVVMLAFMLGMFRNWKANVAILFGAVALFAAGLFLARSETTVQDHSYMSAMIPHHSIAILTSERSEIADVRVCELAVGIIEAQRREIDEMDWLIEDVRRNGIAATAAEAEARPIPEFVGTSQRTCDSG